MRAVARLAALLVALSVAAPGPADAQTRVAPFREAIATLADGVFDQLLSYREAIRGVGGIIHVSRMADRVVQVACQPLSDQGGQAFLAALGARYSATNTRFEIRVRDQIDNDHVLIRLSYARSGEEVEFRAEPFISFATDGARLQPASARTTLDSLRAEDPFLAECVESGERYSLTRCEAVTAAPVRDSPSGIAGRVVRELRPGDGFDVIAGFADNRAVLVEMREEGVSGATMRGFLVVRPAALADPRRFACEDASQFRRQQLQPLQVFRDCPACPDMVLVDRKPAWLGSAAASPLREPDEIVLGAVASPDAFAVSVGEVTGSEWRACVDAGGCRLSPAASGATPVAVGLEDARAYVAWLSEATGQLYRLPTEAEWEYAARAGAASRYAWGDIVPPSRAVCRDCGGVAADGPQPRGGRPPNAFLLHDVHGNLWEWTSDCAGGAAPDGCARYVIKGGGFRDSALAMRFGNRNHAAGDTQADSIGLRVVRSVQ